MFEHERLDAYQASIQYVADIFELADRLPGQHKRVCDQLLRASQSIPLNIAKASSKPAAAPQREAFEAACSSTLECVTLHDVLLAGKAVSFVECTQAKKQLDEIQTMLTKLSRCSK